MTALLAGCAGSAAPRAGADEALSPFDDGSSGARFVAFNSRVHDAGQGTEPMLGITPTGEYYTYSRQPSPDVRAGPLTIFHSADGQSWRPDFEAPASFDPDLVVDSDGTVWFDTYLLPTRCNLVAVKPAGSSQWTTNPHVCVGASTDRPRIVPLDQGRAFLYHSAMGRMGLLKTVDYGMTWTPVPLPPPSAEGDGFGDGGFWNRATGSVYFTFLQLHHESFAGNFAGSLVAGETTMSPGYMVSRDAGETWERGTFPITWTEANGGQVGPGGLTAGAADAAGNVYMAWAEMINGSSTVRLVASQDDGRTWSAPREVKSSGSQLFPALAAGRDGHVAVAFYESNERGRPDEVSDDADWRVAVSWTASWPPEGGFKHGHLSLAPMHHGPVCLTPDVQGAAEQSSCERSLGDFFDLQSLADGRVAAVWVDTVAVPDASPTAFGVTSCAILGDGSCPTLAAP